jgi:hypothetical protein
MKTNQSGIVKAAVAALLVAGAFGNLRAAPISMPTDPALENHILVDFESEVPGVYYEWQGGYTTLVGGVNFIAPRLYIDGTYAGQYNSRGKLYLSNGTSSKSIAITFPQPVSAFGFLFGNSDVTWTLTAYDTNNAVVDSMVIAPTHGSNAGDFFGLAGPNIAYAVLSQDAGIRSVDLVLLDNLQFVPSTSNGGGEGITHETEPETQNEASLEESDDDNSHDQLEEQEVESEVETMADHD